MVDYCRHAFGPAADAMLAWFRRLEQAMVDADRCLSYGQESPQRWGRKVFPPPVMAEASALLDRALSAALDGSCRQRVVLFKAAFDESRQSLAGMKAK
jgi:hypothetical protein